MSAGIVLIRRFLLPIVAMQLAVAAFAQTAATPAPLVFEVSTVKENTTGGGGSRSNFNDGRYVATNILLKNLMQYSAFDLPEARILGGPKWLGSQRFDIEAKLDGDSFNRMQKMNRDERNMARKVLFQQLLIDRFKLKFHWETRELPIYALVAAKNGPMLEKTKEPGDGASTSASDGKITAKNVSLAEIARTLTQELSRELGRVVVDKTGIAGKYDIAIKWTPDNGDTSASSADNGPSIFTAMEEQLGLRLESSKGPVQVLVIDQLEMPSDN
jgi:uncharacterized protein (TIGR03435 family)